MILPLTVDQAQLKEILLNVGLVRPVFIWGAPGIGKSSIVEDFAAELGLPCVCLTGSQLAPEDLIGVPQIVDGTSVFCPPRSLVRKEPFCLFLDELNACSLEVQKAFYSLILGRRIGEYHLPEGSIVVAAGNRMQDGAITHPLPSALLNRMFHVELQPSARIWLSWASAHGIHPDVYGYLCARPDHLWSPPPKTEGPFSTPRSWHMLSDALSSYGAAAQCPCLWRALQRARHTVSGVLQAGAVEIYPQQDSVRHTALAGCTREQRRFVFSCTESARTAV